MKSFAISPERLETHFLLNPNLRTAVSGFRRYLRDPIQIGEPAPEFALTVPAELFVASPKQGENHSPPESA